MTDEADSECYGCWPMMNCGILQLILSICLRLHVIYVPVGWSVVTEQTGFFVYLPFLQPDQVALLVQKYRATSYYGDGRSVHRMRLIGCNRSCCR